MTKGERIRAARIKQGLTLEQVANRLGITPAGIAQWEQNRRNPKLSTLQKIAKALDIDVMELIDESEKDNYIRLPKQTDEIVLKSKNPELDNAINILLALNTDGLKSAVYHLKELQQIPKYYL